MDNKHIAIGLLGLGTVGTGIMHIITEHQHKLCKKTGLNEISVKKALVRDLEKANGHGFQSVDYTTDGYEVVTDEDIQVVIEVMGGITLAKELIEKALDQGKHVVTANKDLMALHGEELLQRAKRNQVELMYEASVAGGIPILRALNDGLSSDQITKIVGIVNGTTNYMLTKMSKEDLSYDEALKEAQEKGFAESDPTSDVGGLDAARKMVILARLGFSTSVELNDVYVSGMTEVTSDDIDYGKKLGYTLKLIGLASKEENGVEVSVEPVFVPDEHPLATVNDEFNAVYVYGDAVGETMFYGPGAGSLPTATAVVSDVVSVIRHLRLGVSANALEDSSTTSLEISDERDVSAKFFVRLHAKDVAGAFESITAVFSKNNVSFEKLIQSPFEQGALAEVVIVTHETTRGDFDQTLEDLKLLDVVTSIKSRYRVEGGTADVLEEQNLALV